MHHALELTSPTASPTPPAASQHHQPHPNTTCRPSPSPPATSPNITAASQHHQPHPNITAASQHHRRIPNTTSRIPNITSRISITTCRPSPSPPADHLHHHQPHPHTTSRTPTPPADHLHHHLPTISKREKIEIILYLAEACKLFYIERGVLRFSTGNNAFLRP